MPKPKSPNPRTEQVLVRLTRQEGRVLTAVAHLEGVTANAYAYAVLSEHLAALAGDPHIRADLANRTSYDAARADAIPIRGATNEV